MNSQESTAYFDSPSTPKSIFGFEPISGATPGGHQFQTQRSLLAELLQASEFQDLAEEHDDCDDDDGARHCLSASALRPSCCTCNVGQCVPREYHARECAMVTAINTVSQCGKEDSLSTTLPIAVPTKTYYKTAKQIEERQRIQYQRQCYRIQQEAQEQALAARGGC